MLVRSVRTSHACSLQDIWKSKSAKGATSRKAGYAPDIVYADTGLDSQLPEVGKFQALQRVK